MTPPHVTIAGITVNLELNPAGHIPERPTVIRPGNIERLTQIANDSPRVHLAVEQRQPNSAAARRCAGGLLLLGLGIACLVIFARCRHCAG